MLMHFNSSIAQDCQWWCITLLLSIIHNSSPYGARNLTLFGVLGYISVVAEIFSILRFVLTSNIQLVGSYFFHVQEDMMDL